MKKHLIVIALPVLTLACGNAGGSDEGVAASEAALEDMRAPEGAREVLDVSRDACPSTHPLAGRDLALSKKSHGVRGTVRIVDDCTLAISDFDYDGKGRLVELFGAVDGSFIGGIPLSRDLLRPNKAYVGALLIVRLPKSVKMTDIDGLSVWCSDVGVSFGDVSFL